MKSRIILVAMCFIILSMCVTLSAADVQPLSENEKVRFSDNLILPSPGELFVAIDKLGEADWTDAASYSSKYDYNNNYSRALNLGVRAADGFLAIQAQDKEKLGDMIVVILTLAEELLVREAILDKGKMFDQLAREEKWDELHRELDSLRDDVIEEMKRLGDREIALLVSAGGWIEGLRATTKILNASYKPKASSILYQPTLVDYFNTELGLLSQEAQASPSVKVLIDKLPQIKDLVNVGFKKPVPAENVAQLNELSSELIANIEKD